MIADINAIRAAGNGWVADYLAEHGRFDFFGTDVESDSRRPDFLNLDGLLERLGFRDDEFVSVCHEPTDGVFTASGAVERGAAAAQVRRIKKQCVNAADVWFGVNPISESVPRGRKGKASDVTRLSALWADLDVGPGKCASLSVAHKAVDQLSEVVGSRPVAITSSGGGLQPYWTVKDGPATPMGIQRVLLRWKVVVKTVVADLQTGDQREAALTDPRAAAKADSVFNADRVLRVPNTYNCKDDYAESRKRGRPGVLVRCRPDTGRPLSVEEIEARLDEFGVDDLAGHDTPGAVSDNTSTVDEIWRWAEETLPDVGGEPCEKMQAMAEHWQRQIDQDASSHDKINDALWTLACTATEGHRGLSAATMQVQNFWIEDVKNRGKRTLDEFRREIFRSGVEALRKLKGEIDSGRRRLYGSCGCGEYGGNAEDDLEAATDRAYVRLKADVRARQRLAAEVWTPPDRPGNLLDQLTDGVPETDWIIEGLIPSGIVQVNAQYKAGKTTLLMNYARALATGESFLGRFPVNVDASDRVGYLNMELSRAQMLQWWSDMDLDDDAYRRIELYHARDDGFSVLDFSNDMAVDWLVDWLEQSAIRVLVADPLSKLYNPARWGGASDPNAAYTQWWKVLEDVVRRADLRGVIIAHHTGFGEETADRARGASAMMDNPDVNMSFRHGGDHGGKPAGSTRYLTAYGRDVDVEEFELDYDTSTRTLTATGNGSRLNAELETQAERLWSAVLLADKKGEKPNKSELFASLGWKDKGSGAKNPSAWYREALRRNWVETQPGKGNAVLHVPGDCTPTDTHTFAVRLGADAGEDE